MYGLQAKFKDSVEFRKFPADAFPSIERLLEQFPLHAVQLIIPKLMKLPPSVESIFSPSENSYVIVRDLPVTSLVDKTFIETFIQKGSVWALSLKLDASYDNFVAILPKGKLSLCLRKELYEVLAITEDPISTSNKKTQKAISCLTKMFSIDLKSKEPTKNDLKFISELKKLNMLHFDIILKWIPDDLKVCSSTLLEYFKGIGLECHLCNPEYLSTLKYSVLMPIVDYDKPDEEINSCLKETLLNWIGTQSCAINTEDVNDFVSTFSIPDPTEKVGQLFFGSWKGFFSHSCIKDLIEQSGKIIEGNSAPYAALVLHGFEDSWVQKGKNLRITSGDKMHYIVIFPGPKYWMYTLTSNLKF